jgi:hypothetical protein
VGNEIIDKAIQTYGEFNKDKTVKVFVKKSVEGVAASVVLKEILGDRKFAISFVDFLDENVISRESYEDYIFVGVSATELEGKKIINLNSKECSCATLAYLFSKELNAGVEKFNHVAAIGAIECRSEESKKLIEDVAIENKIKSLTGIKLLAAYTKPIHKVLEESINPLVPGVSGQNGKGIEFLRRIGINAKHDNVWKILLHLTDQDISKIKEGLTNLLPVTVKISEIYGENYRLTTGEYEGPYDSVKVLRELVHANIKLGSSVEAMGLCSGVKGVSNRILDDYKLILFNALKWLNRNDNNVFRGSSYLVINMHNNLPIELLEDFTQMLKKSELCSKSDVFVVIGSYNNETSMVSVNCVPVKDKQIDCKNILGKIVTNGEIYDGYALVPTVEESRVVENCKRVLEEVELEEVMS